jgi:MFS family permease
MPRVLIGFAGIVIVMIAIPVLLAWSGGRRRLRVGRTAGAVVLRMPRGHHAILAAIAIIPCAALAGLSLAATWRPGNESGRWVLAGFVGLLGTVVGGYLLALEARARIRVDDFSIEKVGAFTRKRCPWQDVAKLTFNPLNDWFFLTVASGARFYVATGLEGISDFAELALQRLPRAVLDASPDAAEALRDLAAG